MTPVFDHIRMTMARFEPFPDESQCPECGYFDPHHPDVERIINSRDPQGTQRLMNQARCKCASIEAQAKAHDQLRRNQANLPDHKDSLPRTMAGFHITDDNSQMYYAAQDFMDGKGPHILVLQGLVGCGKSHILEAVGRDMLERGATVRYDLASGFLDRLRHTYQDASEEDMYTLMEWYGHIGVLLLDDVGLERGTDFAVERLTRIVDERLTDGARTVLATNLAKAELADRLGPRLASRMYPQNPDLSDVQIIEVIAEDYR